MVALEVCGCHWAVGSDDFVYTGLVALLFRGGWLIATAVVLQRHLNATPRVSCAVYNRSTVFVSVLLADLVVQSVLQLVVICVSGRGGMNNTRRDRLVGGLISIQLLLFVVETVWVVVGSVWAFGRDTSCDESVDKIRALLIVGYVWFVVYVIKQLCNVDPMGCLHGHIRRRSDTKREEKEEEEEDDIGLRQSWDRCCRVVCCLADLGEANRGVILDVSRLFSTAFARTGVSGNMVATDFAAALALIQLRQEREEREYYTTCRIDTGDRPYSGVLSDLEYPCSPLSEFELDSDLSDSEQRARIMAYRDACYYMKYALAAYGWPLLTLMHLGTGLCRLAPNCRCCACCRIHTTPNDNCLECHTSAILCQTGLARDDLIDVTYHNTVYKPPYFVAVDRERQAIVVSIRGTMSISDALTDITADPVQLPGSSQPLHAHGGIYKAASFVKRRLDEGDTSPLQKAFEHAKRVDPHVEYNVVITGHSLGAGTASILALLYVLENRYPDLVCFAYSPPGGLLSIPAVELTKKFTTSIVLGKDMIPRLSLEKAYKLLDVMKCETESCQSPKWLIQLKCFCACCCKRWQPRSMLDDTEDDTISKQSDEHTETTHLTVASRDSHTRSLFEMEGPPLYLPGYVIHLVEVVNSKGRTCYRAFWTDYRGFHTLLVGAAMIHDHLPHRVNECLQGLHQLVD
ncbi:diacylglycerol lipase-alpha-like [Corticium candelabrum]|uniref:diacylglycerol lipase-alpha-like n=1 Tax=Corticium candelabrum TaxID=121492 RepID=UPI002E271332|nr:diacylglycerol lipase-alpha-like [Corticium candelabrum]